MKREPTRHEIKALFGLLVTRCGGVEAAGARLGISHQRVSQLQTLSCADMPTLVHVVALEAFCSEAIVTGALARAVSGEVIGDILTEALDATEAAVDLQRVIRSGADLKTQMAAALDLKRDAEDVIASLSRSGD